MRRARPVWALAIAVAVAVAAVACSGRKAAHCVAGARHGAFTMSFLQEGVTSPTLVDYSCGSSALVTDTAGVAIATQLTFSQTGDRSGAYAYVELPAGASGVVSIAAVGTADVAYLPPPLPGTTLLRASVCAAAGSTSAGAITLTGATTSAGSFQLGGLCATTGGNVTQVLGTFSLK